MKKLLLFFVSLATLLWLLTSCDSFKKNEVNPAPTTEVVNQAVVDLVKLYYPNATDIVIKEIVKDRVWSARFFVGDKEITLSVDNNNEIIKSTNTSRINGETLDVPDKILAHIKANYKQGISVRYFTLLLDENANRLFYLANITGLSEQNTSIDFLKFDMQGNFAGFYKEPDYYKIFGSYISQWSLPTLESAPEKIKQYIKKYNIDKLPFNVEFPWRYKEGSYSIQINNQTNGIFYRVDAYYPAESIFSYVSGYEDRKRDYMTFQSDGSLMEWQLYLPNSTRGDKTIEIVESQMAPKMTQMVNRMFGEGKWRLDYGIENYKWFTRNGQTLRFELKENLGTFYETRTYFDGNLASGLIQGYFDQIKLVKYKQDVPADILSAINQRFLNWKIISGRVTLGRAKVPTGEITANDGKFYVLRIEADGRIYEIDNGMRKININER